MFAFYFSVKTVRAMVLHQIGKMASLNEFEDNRPDKDDSEEDAMSQIKHAFKDDSDDDEDETPPHRPTFYEKREG